MRRRLLVLVMAATYLPLAALIAPASASSCTDDYCDPPPHPVPHPVWVETGCGTVTVHAVKYERTVDTNICPGPMP